MSPPIPRRGGAGLRRYRAERLLRKDFAGLRGKVLAVVRAQLRGKGVTLDPADLEACYAQAWQGLYASVLEGEQIENPTAWLVLVTFRRAIDESRAASRTGVLGDGDLGSYSRQLDAGAPDLASELDDRTRLRHVFEAMRATLSERECEAASLCYLQGLSRAEAARRMGVSEARMRKLMEGAGPARPGVAAKVGELLETIRAGGWCEQQASLMRAYAFGILDPQGERHALAAAHCDECPACRAYVASLRGLASVLPLPLLPRFALAGASGTAATAGGGAAGAGGGAGAGSAAAAASGAGAGSATAAGSGVGGAAGAGAGGAGSATGLAGGSGLFGSLAAKLALAAAAVVFGSGYALLGNPARGSAPARPPAHVAGAVSSAAALPARFPAGALDPMRRSPSPRRRSARPPHSPAHRVPRSHAAPPASEAAAREFSPERVGPVPAVPARSSAAPSPSTGAGNEFGIE